MTDHRQQELSRLLEIDRACDQFEEQWQQGASPTIEDFLDQTEPAKRSALLRDFLLLEWRMLEEAGQSLCFDDYRARFSDDLDDVEAAHREFAQPDFEAGTATKLGADDGANDTVVAEELPETIGTHRVIEQIGAGGMGTVYRAEDTQLKREVAIKVMNPEIAAKPSAKERFVREAQALAAINHDHVVTVHQVSEDNGVPYLEMEFLEGESLKSRIQRVGKFDDSEVLRIGGEVAAGLAAAHQRGLYHRDIKPDNIWLEAGTDRVKILDFGLARLVEEDVELTHSGAILGTPRYMSPEQARGEKVDHRSDLFSLGSVLYRLATGQAPFALETVSSTLMAVAEKEPEDVEKLNPNIHPTLVVLINRLLQKHPADRFQSADEVVAEIRDIERKLRAGAVEKTKSAQPTLSHRRRKTRLFVALAAVLLLGVILTFQFQDGTVVVEAPDRRRLPDDVKVVLNGEDDQVEITAEDRWTMGVSPGEYSVKVQGGNDRFVFSDETVTVNRFGRSIIRITRKPAEKRDEKQPSSSIASRGNASSESTPLSRSGGPTVAELERAAKGVSFMEVARWEAVWGEFAPDGKHVIAFSEDGKARVIDMVTQEVVQSFAGVQARGGRTHWRKTPVAFSPDGKQMAAPGPDGTIGVWDWRGGQAIETYPCDSDRIRVLAYAPDGRLLATFVNPLADRLIEVQDVATGESIGNLEHAGPVSGMAFSVDRGRLISVSYPRGKSGQVTVWDLGTGKSLDLGESKCANGTVVVVSSEGRSFFTFGVKGRVTKWDLETRKKEVLQLSFHGQSDRFLQISPNGKIAVTAGKFIRLLDAETDASLDARLHEDLTYKFRMFTTTGAPSNPDGRVSATFSPDGHLLLARWDTAVGLFRLPTSTTRFPLPPAEPPFGFDAMAADGPVGEVFASREYVCSLTADGRFNAAFNAKGKTAYLADVASGKPVRRLSVDTAATASHIGVVSPDGRYMAIPRHYSGGVLVKSVETGRTVCSGETIRRSWDAVKFPATFAGEGEFFVAIEGGVGIVFFDVACGKRLTRMVKPSTTGNVRRLTVSPDTRTLVACDDKGYVTLWQLPESIDEARGLGADYLLAPRRVLPTHVGDVYDAVFSRGGNRLVTCGADKKVIEWDLATGRRLRAIENLEVAACSVALATDGRLLTGGTDGVIRHWDFDSGKQTFRLPGHTGPVTKIIFSPNQRFAISEGYDSDGTVRFWRLPPTDRSLDEIDYQGEVARAMWQNSTDDVLHSTALLPHLEQAITVTSNRKEDGQPRTMRQWDINTGEVIRQFKSDGAKLGAVVVSEDGHTVAADGGDKTFVWSTETGELLHELEDTSRGRLALSQDGMVLISGGYKSNRTLWDLRSGEKIRQYDDGGEKGNYRTHLFLPGADQYVSCTNDGLLTKLDRRTGKDLLSMGPITPGHHEDIRPLAIAPNGRLLIIGGQYGALQITNLQTGLKRHELVGHGSSPDGGVVSAAAFSSDGRLLVTGGQDHSIRIWDVATGRMRHVIRGHFHQSHASVTSCCFTADGRHVLSVSKDGTIRKWKLPSAVVNIINENQQTKWMPLFNDESLSGWSPLQDYDNKKWKLQDGTFFYPGTSSNNFLVSPQTYDDFELEFEAKASAGDVGGLIFRGWKVRNGTFSPCYRLYIKSDADGKGPVTGMVKLHGQGSVGQLQTAEQEKLLRERFARPDRWYAFRVVAQGRTISIGIKDAEADSDYQEIFRTDHAKILDGNLAFVVDNGDSQVHFRNVRILQRIPSHEEKVK